MSQGVAHHIALIPGVCAALLLALYFIRRGERRERFLPPLWVSLGLFVSWWGDSVAGSFGGSVGPSYLWLPVQVWLCLCAFVPSAFSRTVAAGLLIILAAASWNLGGCDPDTPDFLITIVGSVALCLIARGPVATPVRIYFGLGTAGYVYMMAFGSGFAEFFYHLCRLTAYIGLIGLTAPPLIRKLKASQWSNFSSGGRVG